MKQKGLEPRILYPARLSFKFEGGIKQFSDKQKLREFSSHKPSLQCILEGLLYVEVFLRLNRCHPRGSQRVQDMIHNIQRMEEEEKGGEKKNL